MSRLIDADDLIIEILTHDLIGDDKEIDKIILDAPTVKAIPIEWLCRKYLDISKKSWSAVMCLIVNKIIRAWEKENG